LARLEQDGVRGVPYAAVQRFNVASHAVP
jgi:hypothetical protein